MWTGQLGHLDGFAEPGSKRFSKECKLFSVVSQCPWLPVTSWSLRQPLPYKVCPGPLCWLIREPPTTASALAPSKTYCSIQIQRPQTQLIGCVWSPKPISPGPSCAHRKDRNGQHTFMTSFRGSGNRIPVSFENLAIESQNVSGHSDPDKTKLPITTDPRIFWVWSGVCGSLAMTLVTLPQILSEWSMAPYRIQDGC